ncbi:MAG TPA: hypothetical protein VGS21_04470, partial [Acidimicrobiales bacterium]|nr:hypothetical protein [Acidimicrobiales bacterium]
LAERHQVLVVTHLAQVAAFATTQLVVTKVTEGERTVARVARVEGEERHSERARMLSGQPGSESGRAHASELLELASRLAETGDGSTGPGAASGRLKNKPLRRKS